MTKQFLAILATLALVIGLALLVAGLVVFFGAWALVGCGVALMIPILFIDVIEESDHG